MQATLVPGPLGGGKVPVPRPLGEVRCGLPSYPGHWGEARCGLPSYPGHWGEARYGLPSYPSDWGEGKLCSLGMKFGIDTTPHSPALELIILED